LLIWASRPVFSRPAFFGLSCRKPKKCYLECPAHPPGFFIDWYAGFSRFFAL
jgi:hypothetical protein